MAEEQKGASGSVATDAVQATINIETDGELGRIDRMIYGHFLESNFYGNIEGGVFDEGSPLSDEGPGPRNGLRLDVIEACRQLGLPIVRWPGGNFASAYHWEDGTGPRDQRPRRLDLTWRGEESNRFGTDEFLAWCDAVATEAYLVPSCRSVDEAVRWVEYTNYAGDTFYTRLRAANGHPEPYGVRYWGLGNEVFGPWQMGYRSPEQYAWDAAENARFMRLVDPSIKLIAVGYWRDAEAWTQPLIGRAGKFIDYVSIHLYGANTYLYTSRSGDDDYEATVAQSLFFEEQLRSYAELVALLAGRAGVERPLALSMDEWNMRHLEPVAWPEAQPGANGGIAPRDLPPASSELERRLRVNRWSPRTLADALFYAGVFHTLQRLSGLPVPPSMANTVNLINANALIAVRPEGLLRHSTYYVWDLYQNHTGSIALPIKVEGPSVLQAIRCSPNPDAIGQLPSRPGVVPLLDAAATRSADRRLTLTVINRHRATAITARIVLDGMADALPPRAHVLDLGVDVDDVQASNSSSAPERVATRNRGRIELENARYTFPPHSLTLLSFKLV